MGPVDKATAWSLGLWLVAVALITEQHNPWLRNLGPSDWAAWVQAFGSIGAILGSFAMFRVQREAEQQSRLAREVEEETQQIVGARRVVMGAVNVCIKLRDSLRGEGASNGNVSAVAVSTSAELKGVFDALSQVTYLRFKDWQVTEAVMTSRAAVALLIKAADGHAYETGKDYVRREDLRQACDAVGTTLGDRHIVLARACVERGVPADA